MIGVENRRQKVWPGPGGGGGLWSGGGGISIGLTCLLLGELLIGGCVCRGGRDIFSLLQGEGTHSLKSATILMATMQTDNREHIE